MDRLRNPFTPGAGALPPELAGRANVMEDGDVLSKRTLMGKYEKSLLLIGLRGVGKTVLLRHLAEKARGDGVIPILVEMRNDTSDVEELSVRIKEALSILDFKSRVKSTVNQAFLVLKNFVKTLSVNIGDFGIAVETNPGIGDSGNMEYDLSEVLMACARAAKESNTAIGLYIDELQNMDIHALRGVIVALHHAAQESLPLYLVGSGLPTIRGLIGKSKTYAERMFNYAELGALSEAEVSDAVVGPMRENGVSVDDEAVKEIFAQSHGYPYFLQEYGYQLWLEAENPRIEIGDVRKILPAVTARLDRNFFDVRFDRIANAERRFLRAMAETGSPARISEVARVLDRTLGSLSPVRSSLIRKGMVFSPALGEISYTVPLFAEYVKRVMPTLES